MAMSNQRNLRTTLNLHVRVLHRRTRSHEVARGRTGSHGVARWATERAAELYRVACLRHGRQGSRYEVVPPATEGDID